MARFFEGAEVDHWWHKSWHAGRLTAVDREKGTAVVVYFEDPNISHKVLSVHAGLTFKYCEIGGDGNAIHRELPHHKMVMVSERKKDVEGKKSVADDLPQTGGEKYNIGILFWIFCTTMFGAKV